MGTPRLNPLISPLPSQSMDSEDSSVPGRRASLSDLTDLEDIEGLTVRQLKEILARNFVNYKGCCEKWELMERVTRLYKDQKGLQHLGEGPVGRRLHGTPERWLSLCSGMASSEGGATVCLQPPPWCRFHVMPSQRPGPVVRGVRERTLAPGSPCHRSVVDATLVRAASPALEKGV